MSEPVSASALASASYRTVRTLSLERERESKRDAGEQEDDGGGERRAVVDAGGWARASTRSKRTARVSSRLTAAAVSSGSGVRGQG